MHDHATGPKRAWLVSMGWHCRCKRGDRQDQRTQRDTDCGPCRSIVDMLGGAWMDVEQG